MLQHRILKRRAASGWMLFLACSLAGAVLSASEDEHREHGAHEHGRGTLDIAVEGEELVVEFRIPAANVVGFEHAPRDDAEREAVRRALAPFQDAASLLEPSTEAECELEMLHAGLWRMDLEEAGEGEEHGHEEHEREEEERADEAHSELRATYHFHCHAPEELSVMEVRAFEHLLDADEIDVRVVTPGAQRAMELHPPETRVELGP